MIPNIFISSTISDLHYLRDGLRETIEELSYHPVMSDYAEVGYLVPTTAAESCYRSIKDCHLVVLIIGRRYGEPGKDGLSVTHKELLTAIEEGLPLITFVEPQIINYKEVHDADPTSNTWDLFKGMDHARKTFALLNEVTRASAYNGVIPIISVSDAKRKLKLQIANFVGERLGSAAQPIRREMQEVLAQVTAIRTQLAGKAGFSDKSKRHLVAMRFLLDDRNSEYRKLLETLFGDLDPAIEALTNVVTFEEVISLSGHKLDSIPDDNVRKLMVEFVEADASRSPMVKSVSIGVDGGCAIFTDGTIKMNKSKIEKFESLHKALSAKLKQI